MSIDTNSRYARRKYSRNCTEIEKNMPNRFNSFGMGGNKVGTQATIDTDGAKARQARKRQRTHRKRNQSQKRNT